MAALIKIDHDAFTSAGRSNTIRFCSRCGEPAEEPPRGEQPPSRTRVCQACGMGMLLSCAREALPGAGAAFVIATVDLEVSALSESAEAIFGLEQAVLGRPLLSILTSPMGDDYLARVAGQAALRSRDPVVLPARGASESAASVGMLAARVSTCGRPRAALITVEHSGFGRR